jgi:integrase
MGRPTNRLTAIGAQRAIKRRGSVCDGGGLWLISKPPNGASWVFRYAIHGKDRWMGLGPYPDLPLADARTRAAEHRHSLALDIDPIEQRRSSRDQVKLEIARRQTFRQCADQYIAAHAGRWKHEKTGEQWRNSLARLVYPLIGALPVAAIDDGLVIKVLQPIWNKTPETASRVRSRIEAVLSWATVMKARPPGPNPARWKGHLDQVLPAIETLAPVKHFAALPYAELPAFMTALRGKPDTVARALEFSILTAARTGEAMGARWDEIDLAGRMWTISAERMKGKKDHRVPLSSRAVTILEGQIVPENKGTGFIFPGAMPGKPLSHMAFLMLLRRMGYRHLTAHGFRSTFRDWAAEQTNFPHEVAEMALAHAVGNKVEAAYRRGDLFEKRRRIMDAWASVTLSSVTDNVVQMRGAS